MPEGKYIEHPSLNIVFHDKSVVRVLNLLLLFVLSTQFKGIGIVNKEIGNCRRQSTKIGKICISHFAEFEKNVEWSWQNGNNYNPIATFNALNQNSLMAIS